MNAETPTGIIKGATNEWVLLAFRGTTSILLAIITGLAINMRDDVKSINKDLADFKLAYAERIAKVEGQVGELKGSLEVHRSRLKGLDDDSRALWNRLYDQVNRSSGQPTKGIP